MKKIAVVDAHVHVFPLEMCAGRSTHIERDRWFSSLYGNPKAMLATAEDLVASMDGAGIARSIACGFPWADSGLCREHNAYLADAAHRFPDRLSWLGIVNPRADTAERDARWCFENGASGLGEINADAQGIDLRDSQAFRAIAGVCIEADHPLLLHASEHVGHAYPGKGTATPEKLLALLSSFLDLRVVAAHWGGGLPFYELMPEVAALTGRLSYDSGASTYLYGFQVFRTVLDIVGRDRVLFGSDYPVLKQGRFLELTRATSWRSDDEQAAVLSENAVRVYGLPVGEACE